VAAYLIEGGEAPAHAGGPALRSNLAYDPIKHFAPVGVAVFNTTANPPFPGHLLRVSPSPTVSTTARKPTRMLLGISQQEGGDAVLHG
jgi:hypothetical protein